MAKKSRRQRANNLAPTPDHNIIDTNQQGTGNCSCDHGLTDAANDKALHKDIRHFLRMFKMECIDEVIAKKPNEERISYFAFQSGYIQGSCRTGRLSLIKLHTKDLEKINEHFVPLGTDCLVKSEGKENTYGRLACSLAMITYMISQYSGGGARGFHSLHE